MATPASAAPLSFAHLPHPAPMADDARAAIAAGADGVAVRRALLDAADPIAACAEIARALPAGWLTERVVGANTSRDA